MTQYQKWNFFICNLFKLLIIVTILTNTSIVVQKMHSENFLQPIQVDHQMEYSTTPSSTQEHLPLPSFLFFSSCALFSKPLDNYSSYLLPSCFPLVAATTADILCSLSPHPNCFSIVKQKFSLTRILIHSVILVLEFLQLSAFEYVKKFWMT